MPWQGVHTKYSIHWVQHTPSKAYTEFSIHQVQHPPNFASLHFIPMITRWPVNVVSASIIPPCMIDRHHPAHHENWKVKSHSHGWKLTNYLIQSQYQAPRPSTTSKYSSKVARSQSPSANLHTHSITACECISTLTRLRTASLHNHILQVHHPTCLITASKFVR